MSNEKNPSSAFVYRKAMWKASKRHLNRTETTSSAFLNDSQATLHKKKPIPKTSTNPYCLTHFHMYFFLLISGNFGTCSLRGNIGCHHLPASQNRTCLFEIYFTSNFQTRVKGIHQLRLNPKILLEVTNFLIHSNI